MSNPNYELRAALTPAALVVETAGDGPPARPLNLRRAEKDLQTKSSSETGRFTELPANDTLRTIGRVGIIGGDAIGIAMRLLDVDIPVTIFDTRREFTAQAVAVARSGYETLVTEGKLAADKRDRRMALLTGAANFHHLKDCDLILAALPSELSVAEKLFRRLDDLVKQSTILVSNHPASEIAHLARFTRRPAHVLGMRFSVLADEAPGRFNLVRGRETSEDVFNTVEALVHRIR